MATANQLLKKLQRRRETEIVAMVNDAIWSCAFDAWRSGRPLVTWEMLYQAVPQIEGYAREMLVLLAVEALLSTGEMLPAPGGMLPGVALIVAFGDKLGAE